MSEHEKETIINDIKRATSILTLVLSLVVGIVGFGITWGVSSERLNNKVDRVEYVETITTFRADIKQLIMSVDDLKKNNCAR